MSSGNQTRVFWKSSKNYCVFSLVPILSSFFNLSKPMSCLPAQVTTCHGAPNFCLLFVLAVYLENEMREREREKKNRHRSLACPCRSLLLQFPWLTRPASRIRIGPLTVPRLHPLRVQMSRSPRCHKVQGHTANPSQGRAYSQNSSSRPGAPRPPPPGTTEPERPHRWRMPPTLPPPGPRRCTAARTEPQLLSGVTGDPRRPLPVPGALRPIRASRTRGRNRWPASPRPHARLSFPVCRSRPHSPHLRPVGQGRSASWNVPCTSRNPLCPLTTDAQGPPGFLDGPRGCTSAPQQPLCAPLTFPWAGKLETPPRFPRGRVEQPRLCLTSRFPRVCQLRFLDLGCACHLLGARGEGRPALRSGRLQGVML